MLFLLFLSQAVADLQQDALNEIAAQISRDKNVTCTAPTIPSSDNSSTGATACGTFTAKVRSQKVTALFVSPLTAVCARIRLAWRELGYNHLKALPTQIGYLTAVTSLSRCAAVLDACVLVSSVLGSVQEQSHGTSQRDSPLDSLDRCVKHEDFISAVLG